MLNPIQKAAVRHLVAYESSPPESRLKHQEWCEQMGVTIRTLQRWQLDDEFQAALSAQRDAMEETSDPYALVARTVALEQLMALMSEKKLTVSERRQVIKDIMEFTKHVDSSGEPVSYEDMTDEDLVNAVLNRGLSPLGMTESELKSLVRGKPCSTSSSDSPAEPLPSSVEDCSDSTPPSTSPRKTRKSR